ncbi:MAG: flavin reductase family protein [Planctomycetales bacterium]|nr:flavin reductase family protein [Planctomycetales bacterium]
MIESVYERLFRRVNREVWVVTAAHEGHQSGLLATWVSQASIDPIRPYVLVGIAPNHFTGELLSASGGFVVHLPSRDQARQVISFALGSGRDRDKLEGWDWTTGPSGAPRLSELPYWLECRSRAVLQGGDRLYVWAEAIDGAAPDGDWAPLCEHDLLAAATSEELASLKENREHDSAIHGPWFAEWLDRVSRGESSVTDPNCRA